MLAKRFNIKLNFFFPKKVEFLGMLLGTLGSSFLGNLSAGKAVKAIIPGRGVIRASKRTIKAGQEFQYCLIF